MDIIERLMQQIGTGPDVEDIVFINPDGPEAADEIERLRGQVEFEKKCRNDAFDELKKQDAEIERLREALQHMVRWHDQLSPADIAKAEAALKEKKP